MAQPCDQLLPQNGTGYRGYKSDSTRYGTAFTVNFIRQLGVEWHALKPHGPRLLIGDLSPKGGGKCPNGGKDAAGNPTFHKSHDGGWDFDVQRAIRMEKEHVYHLHVRLLENALT